MSAMITADWFMLSRDLYYRKFEIYTMGWQQQVNMDNLVASVAPYGGPIALMRDRSKPTKVQSNQPAIQIFLPSGRQISSISCSTSTIVKLGWTTSEEFICVHNNGSVSLYSMYGDYIRSFDISQEAKDTKIIDAIIFTNPYNFTGIAILSVSNKIFFVNNVMDPKMRQCKLPRSIVQSNEQCWVVISRERDMEFLVARGQELYRLSEDRQVTMLEIDITHKYNFVLGMAVSFNTKHIALLTDAGYLWMGSSDLTKKYCEVDTEICSTLSQIVWCGNEAVVLFFGDKRMLLIVGKHGEMMNFTYDGLVHLVEEVDGVRVISSTQHELVQKVPDVVQKILRINSTEPGSFLLEASKQFQKRSHRADEYISLVKNNLHIAVEQCIKAAGYEFDTDVQKILIRAAQFGKCFIANIDSDEYVQMCRELRVLNAVRNRKIGIPLTYTQLHCQGYKALLDRLVVSHHYYLAIEIAKYLKMSNKDGTSRILAHWAKYKVSKHGINDEILSRQIADKLGYAPSISFSDIANAAVSAGRTTLAIKLLEYESKASEQVQLLLKLEEYRQALIKALESGDTDQAYKVILKSRDKMSNIDFKGMLQEFPVALSLYIKFCREYNSVSLRDILKLPDDHNALALLSVVESLDKERKLDQNALLWSAINFYKAARNDLCVSLCDDHLKLIAKQKSLDEKYSTSFVDLSVHDTCKKLLNLNHLKEAERFRTEFKIPDRRYWWLKIQSMADTNAWEELDQFSKSRKSPIGYAPFVDLCLQKLNVSPDTGTIKRLIQNFLPKVSDEVKVKYYVKANYLEDAAKIAHEQRDIQNLLYVQSKCPVQSELSEQINVYISQLGAKKGTPSSIPLFN